MANDKLPWLESQHLGRDDSVSPEYEASRIIDRVWARYLSWPEYIVVRFIFDRTIAYKKRYESIPLTHFINGVPRVEFSRIAQTIATGKMQLSEAPLEFRLAYRANKVYVRHGLNMSKRQVQYTLESLRNKGVIMVMKEPGQSSLIGLDMTWEPDFEEAYEKKKRVTTIRRAAKRGIRVVK